MLKQLKKKERNEFNYPVGRSHKDQIDEMRCLKIKTCYKARHWKKTIKQWENGFKITSKWGSREIGAYADSLISSHYGFNE